MEKIICLFVLLACAGAKKLPSYITPCQRNLDIPSCILANVEAARPYLSNGIPRLSIPPLNPCIVPKGSMSVANFSFVAINMTFKDMDQLQFKDLVVDLDQGVFNVKLLFPLLDGTGEYTMKGSFLGWIFDGFSDGRGIMKNIVMSVKLKGAKKIIDDKVHLEFEKVGFEIVSVDGGSVEFQNLIRDNPEMTKRANEFLNRPEIFKVFVTFVTPIYDAIFGSAFSEVVRNVFLKFPLEQLFPEK